jgi:hypothetical protein
MLSVWAIPAKAHKKKAGKKKFGTVSRGFYV